MLAKSIPAFVAFRSGKAARALPAFRSKRIALVRLRGSGTSDFDNIKVCTEAYPTGSVGNPPAIPPPTSTAGPADVAAFSYANPPFYYNLNDHLGSTRIITNASGTVTASFEYWPFGEVKSQTGCAANNQKFTGKLFDNESGLQYFGARYLSNDLTRFTSVDPAGSMLYSGLGRRRQTPFASVSSPMLPSRSSVKLRNPQSWNLYAYSLSNPINLIDPDGLAERTPAQNEEPNSKKEFPDKKGGKTVREYGPDGRAKKDVDHGHDYEGEGDPHVHDWDWEKENPRQPTRPPKPGEIEDSESNSYSRVDWGEVAGWAAVGAGAAIIIGTIAEDVATAGIGVLDDPAMIGLGVIMIKEGLTSTSPQAEEGEMN